MFAKILISYEKTCYLTYFFPKKSTSKLFYSTTDAIVKVMNAMTHATAVL